MGSLVMIGVQVGGKFATVGAWRPLGLRCTTRYRNRTRACRKRGIKRHLWLPLLVTRLAVAPPWTRTADSRAHTTAPIRAVACGF